MNDFSEESWVTLACFVFVLIGSFAPSWQILDVGEKIVLEIIGRKIAVFVLFPQVVPRHLYVVGGKRHGSADIRASPLVYRMVENKGWGGGGARVKGTDIRQRILLPLTLSVKNFKFWSLILFQKLVAQLSITVWFLNFSETFFKAWLTRASLPENLI